MIDRICKTTPILLVTVAYLLFGLSGLLAAQELEVDAANTQVTFLLEATGHDVSGQLYVETGLIQLDPATNAAAGEIAINARRTVSGNEKRDKTLHRKVLESELFPQIVFHPQRLVGTVATSGVSEIEIAGQVSLHGTEHPLTLPTTLELQGDHWTAKTTFKIPYVAWGMHDPSMLMLRVAKEVQVTVAAAGKVRSAPPEAVAQ